MSFFLNPYVFATIPNFPWYIYDPYWDNTVLLLHGDSVVNNQLIDNSLNALSVTRFGETPKNVLSPFGILGESIDFRQTSNYLTVSGGDWFNFGSNNFTIECWFYATTSSSSLGGIFVKGSSEPGRYAFCVGSAGNAAQFWINKWGVSGPICGSSTIITDGAWHHLAVVRNNNVFTFYVDGVAGSVTNTWTGSIDNSSVDPHVGVDPFSLSREINAFISNLRITKGAALYTSNFTPPTSPLTLTSNGGATPSTLPTSGQVSLLILNDARPVQNNTFLDSSPNNLTITRNGTPTQGSFSPFALSAAPYYPSVNLGSGYFNGTTDYLSAAPNANFNFSSGTFTVEAWVNFNSTTGEQPIVSNWQNASSGWSLYLFGGKISTAFSGSGADVTGTTTIQPNTWYHVAVAGSAGSYKLFVNGIQEGSTYTGATSLAGGSLGIAWYPTLSFYLNGYISNLRITNGAALYTSNFSVPTSPVTTTSNGGATPSSLPTPSQVSLLCNFSNAGIFDNTEKNNLITIGNASLSSSQVKYGTGAIAFDGSGDYLDVPSNTNFQFGTGDFTVEFWIYLNQFKLCNLVDFRSGVLNQVAPLLYLTSSGSLRYWVSATDQIVSSDPLSLNSWIHIALSKSGTSTKMFINGIQTGSTYVDNNTYILSPCRIGSANNGISSDTTNLSMNGFIDDLRITKGVARYTSNFTPPSRAVPDIPYLDVFALQIDTTRTGSTNSNQFNLALRSSTSYDFDIDWGDGVVETYTSSNTTGYNHTYPTAGIYTVTIAERSLGGFPGVFYNNSGDRQKILNIAQFGGNQFGTDWSNAFNGCLNLQISATDFATTRTQNVTSFSNAWNGCTSLTAFPLIDTSKGTNFSNAWQNCSNLNFKTFPAINTSSATNFQNTWSGCNGLTSFPFISTQNVNNFQNTWYNCNRLTSFPAISTQSGNNFIQTWSNCSSLASFPTIELSGCTDFTGTWAYCSNLRAVPDVNYSNATRLGTNSIGIFEGCIALPTINMPFSSTQNVQYFDRAFLYCTNLSNAPVIDCSKGISFWSTWMGPNKLTTFPSNLTLSAGQTFFQAWRDCTLLSAFPDTYDFSLSATNFQYAWYGCTSFRNFPNLSASNATLFDYAWQNCRSLSSFKSDLLSKGASFSNAWRNCTSLRNFELSAPAATTFSSAWTGCSTLSGFNLLTPAPPNCYDSWDSCISFKTFPLIDTSRVTDARYAWYNCTGLTSFPNLELSGCTDFTGTWAYCSNLTAVPDVNYSNATRLGIASIGIFESCTALSSVFMPISSTKNVQYFDRMFSNCTNLREFPTIDCRNGLSFYGICYTATTNFLTSFPLLTTTNVTNFQYAWSNNNRLTTFPRLTTSNGTTFLQSWYNCSSLTAFPDLDFSKATDIRTAWYNCAALSSFPFIDTRRVTVNLAGTWANCTNLRTFPSLTLSGDGGIYDCWANCVSLTSFPYQDITGATHLGFRTGSTSGIANNFTTYGAWGNCRSLATFPALSTNRVTSFNKTWMDCISLTAFPMTDTSSGTDFTSTWQNCYSLSASEFPTLNMSKMTNGTSCFQGVKLTTTSYSALLTALSATNVNNSVAFHGGNSTFNTAGSAARAFLTRSTGAGGRGWTITDGGYQPGT